MATNPSDFWARVAIGDGCWEWGGAHRPDGYGIVRVEGRLLRAHRHAWTVENGPIPTGLNVCHRCDNPPCVRPDHLYVGTQRDNLEDMTRKGRRSHSTGRDQHGSKNHAAKLTEDQVAHIKGMVAAGYYHDVIAAQFGISRANVSYIARKTWQGVELVLYPWAIRDRPVGRPPKVR